MCCRANSQTASSLRKGVSSLIEMQNETCFIRRNTKIPHYLPYPAYLLQLDISHTAKTLYALLLNRVTLSQKNDWCDEYGRVFILFTLDAMSQEMHRSLTTIKKALSELDQIGLLERRRVDFGRPNHLYVKVMIRPEADRMQGSDTAVYEPENNLSMSRESDSMAGGEMSANNYIRTTEENNLNGADKERSAYGRYQNVFLSVREYEMLQNDFPDSLPRFIEEVSNYLAATGKRYRNYEAGIRMWASNDKKAAVHPEITDYAYEGGDSL